MRNTSTFAVTLGLPELDELRNVANGLACFVPASRRDLLLTTGLVEPAPDNRLRLAKAGRWLLTHHKAAATRSAVKHRVRRPRGARHRLKEQDYR